MEPPILVTGGTGTLGQHVVAQLRHSGRRVRVISRAAHEGEEGVEFVTGDLSNGDGVEEALAGTSIVVHCAGTAKGDRAKAENLVRAASRAKIAHLVFISVVGADRVRVESAIDRAMFGYFAEKLGAEQAVSGSGLGWTTLRASQFHDLVWKTAQQMTKLPLVPVPKARFQPVDTAEVAARLVELALEPPAGLVSDLGGPRMYEMKDLLRSYLQARRKHRLFIPVRIPGEAARAVRNGATLCPDRAVGSRTWEQYVAEQAQVSG